MIPLRRHFLRGLTTLPLIGGGLTLIGRPTAVAAPVTSELIDSYVAFLAHEHRAALYERERLETERRRIVRPVEKPQPPMFWFPVHAQAERIVSEASPSSRAALVLSAVGCDWRAGQ